MPVQKKLILFGAGVFGREALHYFGPERVFSFVDNNPNIVGASIEGVPILPFSELKKIHQAYDIVLTVAARDVFVLAAQLEEAGMKHYTMFLSILEKNKKPVPSMEAVPSPQITAPGPKPCKNNVLMISYYFPPLSGSGVFRSIKFAKYLPRFDWWPTVLSTDCPDAGWGQTDESLVGEIPEGAAVFRIPDSVNTMRNPSFTWSVEANPQLAFLRDILRESEAADALFTAMAGSKTGIAELLTFPCPALLWAYEAVQFIEGNMDIQQFQVLYTTSTPYSAHLIGFYLHQKYHIPWVADYRDPWTKHDYFEREIDTARPRYRLMNYLEAILLHHADCNLTPGGEFYVQEYKTCFQLPPEKIMSISNGYDEEDYAGLAAGEALPEKFTLNYCGLFYMNKYMGPLKAILSSIQQLGAEGRIDLGQVRLRFVGDARGDVLDIAAHYGLEAVVDYRGYVSHQEAVRSNIDSSLLLHFIGDDPPSKPVVLSKFYDYLRSGTPILAIAPKDGAVDQILRETGHGKAFASTQIQPIKDMIEEEYRKWKRGISGKRPYSPVIRQFEREHLTGELAGLFHKVQNRAFDAGK